MSVYVCIGERESARVCVCVFMIWQIPRGICFITGVSILDPGVRINIIAMTKAVITLKVHKYHFRINPKRRFINLTKREQGRLAKKYYKDLI